MMEEENKIKHDLSQIKYVIFHIERQRWLKPDRTVAIALNKAPDDFNRDWTTHIDDAGSYKFGETRQFLLHFNRYTLSLLAVPEFMADYIKPW